MKKFLLTSLAALFAVVSFAQSRALKYEPIQVNNVFTGKVEKRVEALKPMPKSVKTQANPFAKKNLRRGAAIGSVDELQGEFILLNYDYDYDSTLVEEIPNRSASALTIEAVDEKTVMIYGMWDADKGITATVDLENDKLIIPAGQVIGTSSSYGDIYLGNAEAEDVNEPLTATIYAGSFIVIDQLWFTWIVYQEKNTRWGPYSASMIALANGIHECTVTDEESGKPVQAACNVFIEQDDSTKAVTVWNYNPDWNLVVDIDIYADKTFMVPEQTVYYTSNYGEFALYGVSGNYLVDLTGKVSETELTSDLPVYVYQLGTGGWPAGTFGKITLIDGSTFDIPELEKGELVVLPEGLTPVAMPFSYAIKENGERVKKTGMINVAVADSVVYFQGIDLQIPEAWVKGTLDAESGIITIPVTYTGAVNEVPHFFAGYNESDGKPADFIIEYDAKAGTFYGPGWVEFFKSTKGQEDYYYGGLFIGENKPTPYTMPETAVAVEKPFTGSYYDFDTGEYVDMTGNVKVAKEGSLVYIQGLYSDYFENDCILGQLIENEGSKYVLIPAGEYVGELASGFQAFLLSYTYNQTTGSTSLGNIVFIYDETNDVYTLATPLVLSRSSKIVNFDFFVDFITGLTIGTDPSGIAVTKSDAKANGQMYNLAGQKVGKDYKGMVIVNGRKFMNK